MDPKSEQTKESMVEVKHRKKDSWAAFDPLMQTTEKPMNDESYDLSKELDAISRELQHLSPNHSTTNLSPTLPNGKQNSKRNLFARHRKTQSLAATSNTFEELLGAQHKVPPRSPTQSSVEDCPGHAIGNPNGHRRHNTLTPKFFQRSNRNLGIDSSTSPPISNGSLVQELSLPSLAKPRPTSFLTGDETVGTSEAEATQWQVEIPSKSDFLTCTKMALFLERYRREEATDLKSWIGHSRWELSQFACGNTTIVNFLDSHRPIVENFLECCEDVVQVHQVITDSHDPELRREIIVIERQRQFICVCRGTTQEQTKPPKAEITKLDGVLVERYSTLQPLETTLFATLDKLTEESLFCDVFFTGHGIGAAIATFAAFRYAKARPQLRIACLVSASPKIGDLRLQANSLSNLKVFRLEINRPREPTAMGHTIRIHKQKATAFRFSDRDQKQLPFLNRNKELKEYVEALENVDSWPNDFYLQDGVGVRGEDNDLRQMV